MENTVLTLNLTVAQVNTILKYIGAGSYVEVEQIIASIREQAATQLAPQPQATDDNKED